MNGVSNKSHVLETGHMNIVILCDDYYTAMQAYDIWISFLNDNEPGFIQDYSKAKMCVETEGDLRYIFCDYRMADIFDTAADVFMHLEEFFAVEDVHVYLGF